MKNKKWIFWSMLAAAEVVIAVMIARYQGFDMAHPLAENARCLRPERCPGKGVLPAERRAHTPRCRLRGAGQSRTSAKVSQQRPGGRGTLPLCPAGTFHRTLQPAVWGVYLRVASISPLADRPHPPGYGRREERCLLPIPGGSAVPGWPGAWPPTGETCSSLCG